MAKYIIIISAASGPRRNARGSHSDWLILQRALTLTPDAVKRYTTSLCTYKYYRNYVMDNNINTPTISCNLILEVMAQFYAKMVLISNVTRRPGLYGTVPFLACVPVSRNMSPGRRNVTFFGMACKFGRQKHVSSAIFTKVK